MKAKLPVKKQSNSQISADDIFGNRQKLPEAIAAELKKKNLVPRFVSIKRMQDAGGFHDKGWQIYQLEQPLTNPITGSVDKTYRVGDLVLAVKTQESHKKHLEFNRMRADAQAQVVKENKQQIRDKIKEGKAESHITLIEGYEENE